LVIVRNVWHLNFALADFFPEHFHDQTKQTFDSQLFPTSEIAVLEQVKNRFEKLTAKQIVEISHQEEGWKANVEGKGLVSYWEFGWKLFFVGDS